MTNFKQPRLWIATAAAASIFASGLATTSAQAFPARPIGVNDAVPSLTENVRAKKRRVVRPRRGGNAAAAAAALGVFGAIAGAAIASSQRDRYYGDGYYYGPGYGYYGPRRYYVAPRPHYYGPRYGYNRGYYRGHPGVQQQWQGDGYYGSGR